MVVGGTLIQHVAKHDIVFTEYALEDRICYGWITKDSYNSNSFISGSLFQIKYIIE